MRAAIIVAALIFASHGLAQPAGQPGSGGPGSGSPGAGHGGSHGAGHGSPAGSPDFKLPDDPRTAVDLPPNVRAFLRYEMRGHLEQLNALMARIGEGNFKEAATFAKSGLAVMGNHPPGAPSPGAFMPPEFRMMGQAMHKAAEQVARVTSAAATPPTVADWKNAAEAMAKLTAACSGCHGSFRIK